MSDGQYVLVIVIMSVCAVALTALEAFIPGISFAGICALILMVWSGYLCWCTFGPVAGVLLLVILAAVAFVVMKMILRSMKKGRISRSELFLRAENSPVVPTPAYQSAVSEGAEGVSVTALRPSGIAEFDGERVHVSAESGFIQPGVRLSVVKIEGTRILVKACENE